MRDYDDQFVDDGIYDDARERTRDWLIREKPDSVLEVFCDSPGDYLPMHEMREAMSHGSNVGIYSSLWAAFEKVADQLIDTTYDWKLADTIQELEEDVGE